MKKNSMTSVLVLLVFTVFMVAVLIVLLNGADLLQQITLRDQRSYNQRTVTQYLTTHIRQADRSDTVFVRTCGQTDMLVFSEEIDGTRYETSVYCYDGYLREMYCQAGLDLPLEFGEEILPAADFHAVCQGSLVQIRFQTADGETETVRLHLRSGEGETP